jgi:hypothetical protein
MSDTNQTEDKRTQVAKHEFLAADGTPTKDIHEATGIRYTDIASGESFDYQIPGASAGAPVTMFAVFGAKTKATNEASQVRQALARGEDVDGSQVDAIREVFGKISDGTWREPGEGRVGAKVDRDSLAMAIVEFAGSLGKNPDLTEIRQRLDDDLKFFRTARKDERISAIYARLTGSETKKADLGALL